MKVVRLRRNQVLYKQGFTHAFKFASWFDDDYAAVLRALNKIYKQKRWRGRFWAWKVYDTHRWRRVDGRLVQSIFIGIRSEAIATQVLLVMQH